MSEPKFDFAKEGNDRLQVRTPVPVCQNVWASFVFEIFPRFQVPLEHMSKDRLNGRYLNRRPNNVDEIADGQAGDYYRHAYVPHTERSERRQGVNGLIHVPEKRIFYLEQIEADLSENSRSRIALLNGLKQVHAETIEYLLGELIQAPKNARFKDVKTTKELRDRLGLNFAKVGLLDGSYNPHREPYISAGEIKEIPMGQLPLYMHDLNMQKDADVLRSQTTLDFLRDLDLTLREDKELAPMDLLQIPIVMREKYSDIVRVF